MAGIEIKGLEGLRRNVERPAGTAGIEALQSAQDAAARAEASIAEGKARAALDRLVAITNSGDAS